MKGVVTREVERFLFRPGLQERARYYGVVFLNQLPLSHAPAQGARTYLRNVRSNVRLTLLCTHAASAYDETLQRFAEAESTCLANV